MPHMPAGAQQQQPAIGQTPPVHAYQGAQLQGSHRRQGSADAAALASLMPANGAGAGHASGRDSPLLGPDFKGAHQGSAAGHAQTQPSSHQLSQAHSGSLQGTSSSMPLPSYQAPKAAATGQLGSGTAHTSMQRSGSGGGAGGSGPTSSGGGGSILATMAAAGASYAGGGGGMFPPFGMPSHMMAPQLASAAPL